MAGRFSDFQVENWLRDLQTCYVGLHYDNPDVAGAYASEVFGGAYIRCKTSFSDPANRAMWNTTAIVFSGLPSVVLTHMAAWDRATNGNLLMSAPLADEVRVIQGGKWGLVPHEFALSFK